MENLIIYAGRLNFLNNDITEALIDGRVARTEKMTNAIMISMRKLY